MGPNRFSARIFKFQKMYTSYNVALAEAGAIVPLALVHAPTPPPPVPTEPIVFTDADIVTYGYVF